MTVNNQRSPREDAQSFEAFAEALRVSANPFGDAALKGAGTPEDPFIWHGGASTQLGDAFVRYLYSNGWIDRQANWCEWQRSEEGLTYLRWPLKIQNADERVLRLLLTVLVRKERFCDGTLSEAFESGTLLAIAERAAALCPKVLP